MTEWAKQLEALQALRLKRDRCDRDVYEIQIEMQTAKAAELRVKRGDTAPPQDAKRVATLRREIADLERQSLELGRNLGAARDRQTAAREKRNTLQQHVKALDSEIAAIEALPTIASSGSAADKKRIAERAQRLKDLRALRAKLPTELERAEQQLQSLTQASADADAGIAAKREQLRADFKRRTGQLESELKPRHRVATESGTTDFETKLEKAKRDLLTSRTALHDAIVTTVPTHPRDVITNLDDSVPFLLLPLRIEARFVAVDGGTQLWLRVYPDDIAVHTHEPVLTLGEVEAGRKYWTELWVAGPPDAAPNDVQKAAWTYLADAFGPQRAAWIARQTKPINWDALPRTRDPVFPQHTLTKTGAWSRAPRSSILPDRFVALLYRGESVTEHEGAVIPDEVILGPDPFDADGSFATRDGALVFGNDFSWASDFDAAVKIGLALRISLTSEQAKGLDKVVVLGVSVTMAPAVGQASVERLIENHHYSPKGFAILRQGTPTNNTDEAPSGYGSDPFNADSLSVETGPPLFTAQDESDGRALADAVGIEYAPLQHVANAGAADRREAEAMNTALYFGTLGYYAGTMMSPVFSASSEDALREFFLAFVTGRGPLPAIRVGKQPYGVLLTSDFSAWEWSKAELAADRQFLSVLFAAIKAYDKIWLDLIKSVSRITRDTADPSATLVDILGLHSGSVAFNQRTGFSTDYLKNLDDFKFGGRYYADMRKNFSSKNAVLTFLESLGYQTRDSFGQLQPTQLLRLVFQHDHTALDPANLVDRVPLSETAPIRPYDEAAAKNYLHWLYEASTIDRLERQDFGAGKTPPTTLLYLMLRRSLLLQLHASSVTWLFNRNIDLSATMATANVYNIRPERTLTKWEAMRAKVGVAVPAHALHDKAVADHLLTTGRNDREARLLTRLRAALATLADLPTARLERLLTEHIDLCTYRLDAWQTGLFDLRLRLQRAPREHGANRRQGIHLGMFGWVEDLKPAAKTRIEPQSLPERLRPSDNRPIFEYAENGGFIQAPSITQAMAGAVLRSGYLSHAHSAQPDLMSVNVTSERVRRALFLLQGVRNGQPIEALLGYQFERELHDAASANNALLRLNQYIHEIRAAFPFDRHYIQQQAGGSTVAIPANNVTNGLKLAESTTAFPYGASGGVVSATSDQRTAIQAAKERLRDSLDAVKDLLLSEGVYQVVQGNVDRAGAVMTAMKDTAAPPEIDIIRTPRSSRLSFTNRVAIQFGSPDPDLASSNPWAIANVPMTPRAVMEPGVNQWLGGVLGDPRLILCRVAHLDADGAEAGHAIISVDVLALQPIDLVYLTGTEQNTGSAADGTENKTAASELESRIAWHYRGLQGIDDVTPVRIEFLKPEGSKTLGKHLVLMRMLKQLLTDSRPLHALDFDPPSKKSPADPANPEGYDLGGLPETVQRAIDAADAIRVAVDSVAVDAVVTDANGFETHHLTLKAAFDALTATKESFRDIPCTIAESDLTSVQTLLQAAATLGVAGAFPAARALTAPETKPTLLDQAMSVSRQIAARIDRATTTLADSAAAASPSAAAQLLVTAGKATVGDEFTILPRFRYNNESDIMSSHTAENQLLTHAKTTLGMPYPAEEWLHSISHVRPRAARWDAVLSVHETFSGARLALAPIQLPYRANDSWLAVELPVADPQDPTQPFNIVHDTLAITLHGDASFYAASTHCGLLVDDWTEIIPTSSEVTGVAFNYDQPNASPPQTLLLAVTPKVTGHWTWQGLVGIVNNTLLRSKLRAVDPHLLDTIDKPEVNVLLPAILADFAHADLNVALDFRTQNLAIADMLPAMVVAHAATDS